MAGILSLVVVSLTVNSQQLTVWKKSNKKLLSDIRWRQFIELNTNQLLLMILIIILPPPAPILTNQTND